MERPTNKHIELIVAKLVLMLGHEIKVSTIGFSIAHAPRFRKRLFKKFRDIEKLLREARDDVPKI